jgi:hypothetical protein
VLLEAADSDRLLGAGVLDVLGFIARLAASGRAEQILVAMGDGVGDDGVRIPDLLTNSSPWRQPIPVDQHTQLRAEAAAS